jgi:hypothetical protein
MGLHLSVPAAIVMGSAIAGGAVYLGLRSRPVVNIVPAVRNPVASIPKSATTGTLAGEDSASAQLVRSAVEHDRSRLIEACWAPKNPLPPKDFQFRLIFDGNGQLLSYAVNDPGEAVYETIARCLRKQKPVVAVPAAGHPTTIQFTMSLP